MNKFLKNSLFYSVFFVTCSLVFSFAVYSFAHAKIDEKDQQISVDEVKSLTKKRLTDFVIVDVRTPKEFAHGALPQAILIDFYEEDFADNVAKLDKSKSYVLYCRTGIRGGKAQKLMQEQGFAKVYNLTGGFNAFYPEKAYEVDNLK